MTKYEDFLWRKRREFGDHFDPSALAPAFVAYFNSGQRVKVAFAALGEMTGRVGVTTGWRPCFLLMRTSRSHGSPWLIGKLDRVVAVKQGRTYKEVST